MESAFATAVLSAKETNFTISPDERFTSSDDVVSITYVTLVSGSRARSASTVSIEAIEPRTFASRSIYALPYTTASRDGLREFTSIISDASRRKSSPRSERLERSTEPSIVSGLALLPVIAKVSSVAMLFTTGMRLSLKVNVVPSMPTVAAAWSKARKPSKTGASGLPEIFRVPLRVPPRLPALRGRKGLAVARGNLIIEKSKARGDVAVLSA